MNKIMKIFVVVRNYWTSCFAFLLFMQPFHSYSQDIPSLLQRQFEMYNGNNYQEKIFVHTDKTVYATGEILWFKAYITDANSNSLSFLSKICYVEIVSVDKKAVMQGKIYVDSGRGKGSFLIPSSIRTGIYLIRAYTNWMKNFDSQFYFEESISIINPNKRPEGNNADSAKLNYVQFFPEGGNLVYGLDAIVAYKLSTGYGKGVHGIGFIVAGKYDTIVRFESERLGMGTFPFSPIMGKRYHAIIQVDNKTLVRDLPEIYNNGWALRLKDEGNILSVNVACNVETEHNIFLFVQTRNSIKFAKMEPLNKGSATFVINKSDIGEGISQFTVFNEKKQPVCERLYFKRPTNYLEIKLNDFQANYLLRSKVNISVSTNDANSLKLPANMSIGVYLTDSLQPKQETNLLNYLWLSSDLKGPIESPRYYFENSGIEVEKAVDNLMLTQGWRRFKWEDVLKNARPFFAYLPEYEGHIITGKLSPIPSDNLAKGINVFLSVPGKNFKFSNATSLASGYIKFNVEKFYGSHELMALTNLADSNYRIFIDNPFSEKYSEGVIQPFNLKESFTDEILLRSIGAQVQKRYQPEKKEKFILPLLYDTTAFYGIPSKTYYLDDYTRFPTMEEVMKEYVKEVNVGNRKKFFYFEVFNEQEKNFFSGNPLVLIDGVPVSNINKIIDIDPLKINKIELTTNRFFLGQQEYNGIVSYSTYSGELDGYQIDPNSLVIEYDGLQLEREFYSPQYETAQQVSNRLPDYRNVLYWLPDLKTKNGNTNISFYTSDIPGKYSILVQGISDSGLVGFATLTFTVSAESNK